MIGTESVPGKMFMNHSVVRLIVTPFLRWRKTQKHPNNAVPHYARLAAAQLPPSEISNVRDGVTELKSVV